MNYQTINVSSLSELSDYDERNLCNQWIISQITKQFLLVLKSKVMTVFSVNSFRPTVAELWADFTVLMLTLLFHLSKKQTGDMRT